MYAIINSQEAYAAAQKLAKGCYQLAILAGQEALSGATLRGRAKSYSGRYKASAQNLIKRCQRAGLPVREEIAAHGKRVLVIG